jgi:hypothetical protein
MKKHKPVRFFPVSQRGLAAYPGISATLLNMTKTGRHGARRLSSASSDKISELVLSSLTSIPTFADEVQMARVDAWRPPPCVAIQFKEPPVLTG